LPEDPSLLLLERELENEGQHQRVRAVKGVCGLLRVEFIQTNVLY
jgi:hypothetical protein